MSRLIYNEIQLSQILTDEVSSEPVYDESGTDYLYSRKTISVTAIIHAELLPSTTASDTPAIIMDRIVHKLEESRKQLRFYNDADGNLPLIEAPKNNSHVDAKNGPIPRKVQVLKVVGDKALLIRYVVDCWLCDCPGGTINPFQSHRWKDSVTMDKRFFSTRTRTGKIIVRADADINPDTLRYVTVEQTGAVPHGFKREKADYFLGDDGLSLNYTFVDKEMYLQPPWPSCDAEGEYIESSPMHGAIRYGEARVHLEGPKIGLEADRQLGKEVLLMRAIQMAVVMSSLADANGQQQAGTKVFLRHAAIRTKLNDNVVDVLIQTDITQLAARKAGMPLTLERFTRYPPGMPPNALSPEGGTRGSAGLMLIAAALGDPCMQTPTQEERTWETPPGDEATEESQNNQYPPPDVYIGTPPDDEEGYYEDTTEDEYRSAFWETDEEYSYDPGSLAIPTTAGVEVVCVQKPVLRRNITYKQRVKGQKPPPILEPLPAELDNDPGGPKLLGVNIRRAAPEPTGAGNEWEFKQQGTNSYVMQDAEDHLPPGPPLAAHVRGHKKELWTKSEPIQFRWDACEQSPGGS